MDFNDIGYEPEIYIRVETVRNTGGHNDQNLVFLQFKVIHSDSVEHEVIRTIRHHTLGFGKQWLFDGDKAQIQAKIIRILGMIQVHHYQDIVERLSQEILDLRTRSVIHFVERVKMRIHFVTYDEDESDDYDDEYDDDDVDYDDDMEVMFAVAPASDEAMVNHLVTVKNNKKRKCVMCLKMMRVNSDMEVVKMPCNHLFHRTCIEDWLRLSGICPSCRALFPS